MKLFICICFVAFPLLTRGQVSNDVNIIDVIREIQQWDKRDKKMTLSWWIPNEYWRIALKDNKQIPQETIKKIEDTFEKYVMIWACDLEINIDGTFTYTSEEEITNTISILAKNGKKYSALGKSEIDGEALTIAESMKPFLAQTIGQMGKGIHFFFFRVVDENNKSLIDATLPGEFKILHSGSEFRWKLPLVTLLPSKQCPIDQEKMKGNWIYCPIHGQRLD